MRIILAGLAAVSLLASAPIALAQPMDDHHNGDHGDRHNGDRHDGDRMGGDRHDGDRMGDRGGHHRGWRHQQRRKVCFTRHHHRQCVWRRW